ncbi:MAG TPA: hypothetical protein VGM10_25850 [Actinocrinis sp.]|jgi:hypothetical protein
MSVPEPVIPFRWDLVRGDRLGGMPLCASASASVSAPASTTHAPYRRPELVACAAKVLARSGGGPVFFAGRSCDSIHDLLAAALRDTSHATAPRLLPFSSAGGLADLTPREVRQWRANSAAHGFTPAAISRASRTVALCDLVYKGGTFEDLYRLLRSWAEDSREPWSVLRRKLRFVGIVVRGEASLKTWRWHQAAAWTRELPHTAVVNVALDWPTWTYLGDCQPKLTASFTRDRWADHDIAPDRSEGTRRALHEAERLIKYARSRQGRADLVHHLVREPAFREPWLRTLVGELRGTGAASRRLS